MLIFAVNRPEVPPLRMPERFRTDVAYFMTPPGEHGVEKMPQREYWIRLDDARTWLADGVVSHNSGSLEQDSDIILLIYRDEVYDRNTTRKGIAEIDLVKHRNGETGQFLLTFQGQYTRFLNYMPDSYAEGVLR